MFSDDITEKYAIKIRMLCEKLYEANNMIGKMSSSSNKVEPSLKVESIHVTKEVWVISMRRRLLHLTNLLLSKQALNQL